MSNRVSASTAGIILSGNGNDMELNRFLNVTGSSGYAVAFNCTGTPNTVTHNSVNDSNWGVISDPGGNVLSTNSFSNVTTIFGPTC
jgi:hypothetical protein